MNILCLWWKIVLKYLKIRVELFLLFRGLYQEVTKDQQELFKIRLGSSQLSIEVKVQECAYLYKACC
jgi:hypothetical protein